MAESEDSEEIPPLSKIKFYSEHNVLPSEKESCSLDDMFNEKKVSLNDFLLIKSLASGAYGKVILSRKKNTKDWFAIKVLNKAKMREKSCQDTIMNERNILNEISTEFVVRGIYTFQSPKFLYMVMEFMKGGDIANLLEMAGCFEEDMARYYIV